MNKIKDLKGFPAEKEESGHCRSFHNWKVGYNEALRQLGELEVQVNTKTLKLHLIDIFGGYDKDQSQKINAITASDVVKIKGEK